MKTKNWLTLVAFCFAAVLMVDRGASDDTAKQKRDRTDAAVSKTEGKGGVQKMHASQRASELIGMNVKNAQGESLGDIEDLVIDLKSGKVRYAALSFGGFLGLGDKLFAVPMSAMKVKHEGDETHFVLNVDKQRLKDAPGFEKDSWPNFGNEKWSSEVEAFYGTQGAAAEDRQDSDRPKTGTNRTRAN